MRDYLQLQFKMINRKLKDFGLEPVFAYLLLLGVFIGFSVFIFERTAFAKYIYVLLALSFIGKLSDAGRNDFLKLTFGDKKARRIRMVENLLVSVPFLVFLVFKQELLCSAGLVVLSTVLALLNDRTNLNFVIPTPFSKEPFEFCIGFRHTFFLYIIAYVLTAISIAVDNFNLGIFAMLLVFVTTFFYYSKPEHEYFVWNFNQTPQKFLWIKIKTAVKYSSFLIAPIFIALLIDHYQQTGLLGLILITGFAVLSTMILAKYADYPNEFNITQIILLVVSVIFPPLLLLFIPYIYNKSKKRLSALLR